MRCMEERNHKFCVKFVCSDLTVENEATVSGKGRPS